MARQSAAVDAVLGRLHGIRRTGKGWSARCPAHEDRQNSLSVAAGDDGRVLLKCFAGCPAEQIVAAIGLTMRDLFPAAEGRGRDIPVGRNATAQPSQVAGLTLAQYAEAKRLPLDFLRSLGLTEIRVNRLPTVRMPYCDGSGEEVAVRFRLALSGENRFRWKAGSKPCLYGLQRLISARKAGHTVLCEGESDAQTLWLHDIPALGVPGASVWREEWADQFDGIETIYVVVEPDRGGEAVREWLSRSRLRDRVWLVHLGEDKDPSGLYLDDPGAFRARFAEALRAAAPWTAFEEEARTEHARWAWGLCEQLAQTPSILDRFAEELAEGGVAGEARVAKGLYLAATSRLLDRPISVAVKGPSSGGKSFLVERVLGYFPPEAYYALSAMSERALAYSEEPLSHRMMVIYEAAGLQGDFASYLMRSLLSEGHLRYETVEKTKAGLRPRLIEREGPTGLIVTTTAVHLHPENETRLLSVTVTDTPEQTRNVLLALAEGNRPWQDLTKWHALQEWLDTQEHRIAIPFSRALAEAVPPVAVRLRRDFGAVLNLIAAHALLHQASRRRDTEGHVVATVEDYAAVRELVADLVADGVEATVPETLRETVNAVSALIAEGAEETTVMAVAAKLGLDKGSASRRVKAAVAKDYLRNLETGRGKPARLVLGEPLPEEVEVLPRPERLECCAVAADSPEVPPPSSPLVPGSDWPDGMPTEGEGTVAQAARPCPRCGCDLFWVDLTDRPHCVKCEHPERSQLKGWVGATTHVPGSTAVGSIS